MARTPEPHFYPSRGGWYAKIGGKQYLLAQGKGSKKEAFEKFHLLTVAGGGPLVGAPCPFRADAGKGVHGRG